MSAAVAAVAATAAMAPPPLRVLGLQLRTAPGATEANCERAAALIRANPGFHLYVCPELSVNGYDDAVMSDVAAHAQQAEAGAISSFFSSLAREAGAHVCYGFLRRQAAGERTRHTICQAVAAPDGELACAYDKMHLCDMGDCSEVAYGLEPGDAPASFMCGGVRVGLSVCYDIRFPELFRALAWDRGCDLILNPSAFSRDATFFCYHTFATARAVENGVYLLSVNHAGANYGDSIAAPPWVGPVPGIAAELAPRSLGVEEGVLPLTVEPSHLAAVRAAYRYRQNVNPVLRPP